jgi:amino acid transporter
VGSKTGADTQEYGRLKPNAVGLFEVIFMAVATAAPITAMTGNVPVAVGFGNETGAPAGYLYAIGREGFISRSLGKTHPTHGSPYVASLVQTAIAGTIIVLFWIAGQYPYLGLYTLMAILGTFAILVVQTLCSFAVIGYFRSNHPEARHWFRTFLAPLLGGIGMATVVVLLLLNSATAAGDASETLLSKLTPWIIIGVFVAGLCLALYLRARSPERYRTIGRIVYVDTTERSDAAPDDGAVGIART